MNRQKWESGKAVASRHIFGCVVTGANVSQSVSVKSTAHPLPLLPFFHVLPYSQVGLYSIPLDKSLLPSF